MALIKQIETKEGAIATYWRINPRLSVDILTKTVTFNVECFVNKDTRLSNKLPVDSKMFSTVLNSLNIDIRQELYKRLPTLKEGVFLTNQNTTPFLKRITSQTEEIKTPFFADAQSDE